MSNLTVANLQRIDRDALAALVKSGADASQLAIIDVRDSDHIGGHIRSSIWVASGLLDHRMPELVRTQRFTKKVVFHCALSQQRGPSAALRYARERELILGPEEDQTEKQEILVLEGGFVEWQEKYGNDETLTEGYVADIWTNY
ncbi:hypothetical protein N7466_001783 [Penicillium verhagenii]|uniref:uncharacterized protein n=1 Tax=Penicillium verhagenii TaxID=1562060 RepID=UPI002545AD82|nr:uncharacterized protein N7466_001783 [Penicillium verhagenii]KAJ5938649.1 hypothetical protein N7466_001783 [Penicillium verhagenii]